MAKTEMSLYFIHIKEFFCLHFVSEVNIAGMKIIQMVEDREMTKASLLARTHFRLIRTQSSSLSKLTFLLPLRVPCIANFTVSRFLLLISFSNFFFQFYLFYFSFTFLLSAKNKNKLTKSWPVKNISLISLHPGVGNMISCLRIRVEK